LSSWQYKTFTDININRKIFKSCPLLCAPVINRQLSSFFNPCIVIAYIVFNQQRPPPYHKASIDMTDSTLPSSPHPYDLLKKANTKSFPAVLPMPVCIDSALPFNPDRDKECNLFDFTDRQWQGRRLYFDPGRYPPPPSLSVCGGLVMEVVPFASFGELAEIGFQRLATDLKSIAKLNNFSLCLNGAASNIEFSRKFICKRGRVYQPVGRSPTRQCTRVLVTKHNQII
jgi:hypothetical protein